MYFSLMNKIKYIFNFIRDRHDSIYKVFLFGLSIFLIVFFSPKAASFQFSAQKNNPWLHEDLLAPYDIPVQKTTDVVEQEEQELTNNKKLYFNHHDEVKEKSFKKFHALLDDSFDEFWNANSKKSLLSIFKDSEEQKIKAKSEILAQGDAVLTKIYNKGIISVSPEIEKYTADSTFYVYKNKYYSEYSFTDVYTPKTANQYLHNELTKTDNNTNKFLLEAIEKTLESGAENIKYNKSQTEKILQQNIQQIEHVIDVVQKGQSIIKRGDIIDDYKYQVIKSFEIKHNEQSLSKTKETTIVLGHTLLVTILITCLGLYILFFRKSLLENNKNLVFILLIVVSSVLFTSIVLQQGYFNVYAIPLCLIPIIIRSFFDSRTAFYVLLIAVLLVAFLLPNGLHFVFIQVVAGMAGLYGFINFKNRTQLFLTSIIVLSSYWLCYLALHVVVEGEIENINWSNFGWLGIAAFLTLLAYPIIYLFEKGFGFISDVTLLELADTNNKLLREMSRKAPGTFQHSLQVANLAETAIYKIGGNALLMRTAALYHDIGKMDTPMYFIENQSTGVDPHDELAYEESAQIIINHVIQGIEIAKKNKLPDLLIDFIRTHHGTTKTEYFYRLYKEENPDAEDFSDFIYPGPIPFSKESAVLMMADSVEAASRSIKQPDVEKIDALVESVIAHQMNQKQFENADITFRDITQIKKIFKKMLMNIYHVRVEYPH